MQPRPLEGGDAGETLQVYREINGPTAYVQGRGADIVPSMVGHGEVGTYLVPQGKDAMEPASPIVDEVLFTLDGLSRQQVEAAKEAISGLVEKGQEVTRDAVIAKLSEQ